MATSALETFVRDALAAGVARDEIRRVLLGAGWSGREIEGALAAWDDTAFGVPAPRPKPYVSAREAFQYIVFFILLGVVTFNLGSLLFAMIDLYVPDVLYQATSEPRIRSAIAALTVGAPLLTWLGLRIGRQRRADPAMDRSAIRKWLTYVTLMGAAAILIGDAIGLVYNFLNGELSGRLFLKMSVIGLLAGGVFAYFIQDAERGEAREGHA